MKTLKVLGVLAALVLAAVAGGAWWLYSSKDALVKAAIEKFGPEITGVAVTVEGVKLDPLEGKGAISGLKVGNPKGYDAPNALVLGEMRLTMDPASITKDVILVREVVIQSPQVTYQLAGGRSNLDVIQKNIDQYVAQHSDPKKQADGPKKKFVIENLYVRDAKVSLGTAMTLPMPDVHLKDIGKKSNGASAGEVARQTWDSIVRGAGNLASRAGTAIKDGAKSLMDGAKNLFK